MKGGTRRIGRSYLWLPDDADISSGDSAGGARNNRSAYSALVAAIQRSGEGAGEVKTACGGSLGHGSRHAKPRSC